VRERGLSTGDEAELMCNLRSGGGVKKRKAGFIKKAEKECGRGRQVKIGSYFVDQMGGVKKTIGSKGERQGGEKIWKRTEKKEDEKNQAAGNQGIHP